MWSDYILKNSAETTTTNVKFSQKYIRTFEIKCTLNACVMFQNYCPCKLTRPFHIQVAFGWFSHIFLHIFRVTLISNFTGPLAPVILQFFALRMRGVACNNFPGESFSHHTHSARLWLAHFALHATWLTGWSYQTFPNWPITRQRCFTLLKEAALAHTAKSNSPIHTFIFIFFSAVNSITLRWLF